ncbi:MAG TPA: CaiB/BaiF CoA-transferase family protein, partial [Candidatus Limnocylindrales bacterium]
LVENHRIGGFARLGFDDHVLRELNPDLVHLAISGFGPTGPDAAKPGYDFIAQAVGGLMSITGQPDDEGGRPVKVGVAISDLATGLFAAVGILAGLLGRERAEAATGVRGQRIDVSLLESTLALLVNQAQNAFVTGQAPGRLGSAHPNIVPYETFVTADGELALAVASERQWPRLCETLGLAGLAADPRFATNGARVTNRAQLRPLLAAAFLGRPTATWLAALDDAEIPAGAINDVAAAFATPQAQARAMTVDLPHPVLGTIRQAGLAFELEATPASIRTAPPLLGEHAGEILASLGYRADEIEALAAGGAI